MSAQVVDLAAYRRAHRPEPQPRPVNPWAEVIAWSLTWWAEWLIMLSAMMRPPR